MAQHPQLGDPYEILGVSFLLLSVYVMLVMLVPTLERQWELEEGYLRVPGDDYFDDGHFGDGSQPPPPPPPYMPKASHI
ncbi:hypothetical protein QBC43DRAFT_283974 [Cladorrhinum sp. PSN259]|nr:hypothetical protein QBC43DRAFT_283974 [Cladorrhinum sp. PSN259]